MITSRSTGECVIHSAIALIGLFVGSLRNPAIGWGPHDSQCRLNPIGKGGIPMIMGVTHNQDGRVAPRLSVATQVSVGLPVLAKNSIGHKQRFIHRGATGIKGGSPGR